MSESAEEMLSRVQGMSEGNPTWDLSEKDTAALRYVLRRLKEAEAKLAQNRCNRGHETLPLVLWDCPACNQETRQEMDVALELLRQARPYLPNNLTAERIDAILGRRP